MAKKFIQRYPTLLIPLLNYAFEKNYPLDSRIEFLNTEQNVIKVNGFSNMIRSDLVFRINGNDMYHLEIQTRFDGQISCRFLEYDMAISIQHGTAQKELSEDEKKRGLKKARGFVHKRPKSLLLNLTHAYYEPNVYESEIIEDETIWSYQIRVMNAQQYSLDEIEKNELYLLIPFIPLRYYEQLQKKKNPEQHLSRILNELLHSLTECQKILERKSEIDGSIGFTNMLIDGFKEASIHLFEKYELFGKEIKKMSAEYYFLDERIAMAEEKAARAEAKLHQFVSTFDTRLETQAKALAEQRAEALVEQRAEALAEQRAEALAEQRAKALAEQRAEVLAEQRAEALAEQRAEALAEQRIEEERLKMQAKIDELELRNNQLENRGFRGLFMYLKNWKHYMF